MFSVGCFFSIFGIAWTRRFLKPSATTVTETNEKSRGGLPVAAVSPYEGRSNGRFRDDVSRLKMAVMGAFRTMTEF
jgi:hypothetical protein